MMSSVSGSEELRAAFGCGDAALVCAAQSGDPIAFAQLCERHCHKMMWRLHRITGNWHDAEDALQDALLNAFRNLHRFESRSSFATWFTSIVINSGLMTLRRKRGKAILLDETFDDLTPVEVRLELHTVNNPESLCARGELQQMLSAAIHRLPPVLRIATELRVVHDHSVVEIARQLGISESAVKSRLSRARLRLRKSLGHTARLSKDRPAGFENTAVASPLPRPPGATVATGVAAWS